MLKDVSDLAITRNLVELMNGDIRVERQIDQGTRFFVTPYLKLRQAGEAARVQTVCASNGQEAVERFCADRRGTYGLILMAMKPPKPSAGWGRRDRDRMPLQSPSLR